MESNYAVHCLQVALHDVEEHLEEMLADTPRRRADYIAQLDTISTLRQRRDDLRRALEPLK